MDWKKNGLAAAILSLVFSVGSTALARSWDLVDVSILYPLSDKMLRTGELLPFEVYKKFPVGFIDELGEDPIFRSLRVVGVRFDPEQKQIRMTWQPVGIDRETKQLTTGDRAAHTFYQLDSETYPAFLKEWTALQDQVRPERSRLERLLRPQGPALGVHPAFSDAEKSVLFARELQRILTRYCTTKNLIQYTAMQLMSPDHTWWSFSGVQGPQWEPVEIPRIKGKKVDFFNLSTQPDPQTGEVTDLHGQFNFYGDDDTEIAEAVKVYSKPQESDRPKFVKALHLTARFQNPRLTHSQNIDCVSCHIAQPFQFWMTSNLKGLKLPSADAQDWFQNPSPGRFNLKNETIAAQSTRILRAFGYFGPKPAINQRVIHESALSADFLNKQK